jgi:hypothetical protein
MQSGLPMRLRTLPSVQKYGLAVTQRILDFGIAQNSRCVEALWFRKHVVESGVLDTLQDALGGRSDIDFIEEIDEPCTSELSG